MSAKSWIGCSCVVLLICATVSAQQSAYPFGVVIGPSNNSMPSREVQQFYYNWASQLGFNVIEHEMMPVAGGWMDWAEVQVAPDQFKWDPYDFSIADAEAAGLDIYPEIFPWKNPPKWLFERHTDLYMHTPLAGADELTKVIRNEKLDTNTFPSLAHPALLDAVDVFATAIATRYKDRKAVRGYIIGEELGLSAIWPPTSFYGIDFSPAMRDAYHAHLRQKFKTIEALNAAWSCPGRYKDFAEVVWKRGWAHEPKSYRGEWLEYYRTLQQVFADYHNRVARAIRKADPDALVMVSAFDTIGNRVGHGAYLPLMKDVQASAYKSFWQDNRFNIDLSSSGHHEAWCSNFSEAETTRGGIQQRYLASRYVRRQFFPAFARGLKGAFLFVFTPDQPEKMSLFEPLSDGSLEPIGSIFTCQQLIRFLAGNFGELSSFKPDPPRIVVLDPNTTFIGQQWDYADASKERVQWMDQTPAIQSYIDLLARLARLNRRFEVVDENELASALQKPTAAVLSIKSNDLIDDRFLPVIQQWIAAGKPVIADDQSGKCNELSRPSDALSGALKRPNVLVLRGAKWAQDATESKRLGGFLDQHLPLRYRAVSGSTEVFTVDYMTAANGDELAVIVRTGPMGTPEHKLTVELDFVAAHTGFTVFDPFAIGPKQRKQLDRPSGATRKVTIALEGYQDVLLVLAK